MLYKLFTKLIFLVPVIMYQDHSSSVCLHFSNGEGLTPRSLSQVGCFLLNCVTFLIINLFNASCMV